jgi:hypothetical protein
MNDWQKGDFHHMNKIAVRKNIRNFFEGNKVVQKTAKTNSPKKSDSLPVTKFGNAAFR